MTTADWNGREIGAAGISTGTSMSDNFGVIGHSNHVGVRGEYSGDPTGSYGELGKDGIGVHGVGVNRGVIGESGSGYGLYGSTTTGRAVYGYSNGAGEGLRGFSYAGDGVYGSSSASDHHAGHFFTSAGTGLFGASVLAQAGGSLGISFWARNSHVSSSDATAVFSNDGSGALFKGFGGDGGGEEIRISNDGTLDLLNDSGQAVVSLTPDYAGQGRVTTQELHITGGSDLAERFEVDPGSAGTPPRPGMVVSIDPDGTGGLVVSDTAYDRRVAGILSGAGGVNTGMTMGQSGSVADGAEAVALTGRVYAFADTANGPIRPGDLLTTSSRPGHAMRATDSTKWGGAILGKSMSTLDEGTGLVLVLVSLQ